MGRRMYYTRNSAGSLDNSVRRERSMSDSLERNILELRFLDLSRNREIKRRFRVVENDTKNFHGDCLFMSLAQFLQPNADPGEALKRHRMIREAIVNFVTQKEAGLKTWNKFSIFLKDNHEERIKHFQDYIPEVASNAGHCKVIKEYRRYMLKDGSFGTMAELDASMELFGFRTTVIQENTAAKKFSVYEIGSSDSLHHLFLLFTGRGDSGHFQILEMIDDFGDVPVGTYDIVKKDKSRCQYVLSKSLSSTAVDDLSMGSVKRKMEPAAPISVADDTKKSKVNNEASTINAAESESLIGSPNSELTKLETCNLRSKFMEDYEKHRPRLASEEDDSDPSDTSTHGSSSTLVSSAEDSDFSVSDERYKTLNYLFLPPWSPTPIQTNHSDLGIYVPEKNFVLVDIRDSPELGQPVLRLQQGKFQIPANTTYMLKNFSENGMFVKIAHE